MRPMATKTLEIKATIKKTQHKKDSTRTEQDIGLLWYYGIIRANGGECRVSGGFITSAQLKRRDRCIITRVVSGSLQV